MFLLLTEYMHKHFNSACTMFMSKKYLGIFCFLAAVKYISDLKRSQLQLFQFVFTIFGIDIGCFSAFGHFFEG